jgi:hypothetical protein
MADSATSALEPTELDEQRHDELRKLAEGAALKGRPEYDDMCRGCLYYLEPDQSFSYCWQPKLRILVGAEWWCHYFEERTD